MADDLKAFAGCDLVIESIVEKLKIKQQLFERLCDDLAQAIHVGLGGPIERW